MTHARSVIEHWRMHWRIEYNTDRPHSALGYLTPAQYAAASNEALALLTCPRNFEPLVT